MPDKIIIYGKDTWNYTSDARRDYAGKGFTVDYRDVIKDNSLLEEMLQVASGVRKVPVIVHAGKVTIGHGGTWGVWYVPVGNRETKMKQSLVTGHLSLVKAE